VIRHERDPQSMRAPAVPRKVHPSGCVTLTGYTSWMSTLPRRVLAATIVVGALLAAAPNSPRSAPAADICGPLAFDGKRYVVCTIDLRRFALRLFLRGADGEPYGDLGRLVRSPEGAALVFAMNAGMYDSARLPVGLYVENGRTLKGANTANGRGNFHLKPNGVFYAADGMAGVMETERFLHVRPRAEIATQSGPMLVIDGRIHPKFSEDSASRKLRNGVGVHDPHTAVFAISDEPVTFGAFAHLFKDGLLCANALFLDGSISSLYAPSLGRSDTLMPTGPIIGAVPIR
jgi:uncharacterized protein YigE (DUF2233 family)